MARLVDPAALSGSLSDNGQALVIVEFAAPELPAGVLSGEQGDSILSAAVAAGQDRILGRLAGPAGPAGVTNLPAAEAQLGVQRMQFTPMFAASVDAETLRALANDPEVVAIHENRLSRPFLDQSRAVIGMPAAYSAGATGSGQVIAVLDTGGRISHEHLTQRVIGGACYNYTGPGTQSTSRCPGGASASTTLQSGDDCTNANWYGCGHGTHVASTAAGFVSNPGANVPAYGVARSARLISINVFSLFEGAPCAGAGATHCVLSYSSDQIAGLERVYALRNNHSIAAVNMSLGGGLYSSACNTDERRPVIQLLTNAGIAVVIAAGNDGADGRIAAPACISEAIAVANTTNADVRARSSNWNSQIAVAAPGSSIRAAYISGNSNNHYAPLTGTSMAAPHVAGAFAAIRTVAPDATVAQIRDALRATGTSVSAAGVSIPRINVDRAVARLAGGNLQTTTTALTGPATSTQGEAVTFSATVRAGTGTPGGSVSFRRGGTEFASANLNASGNASATVSDLPQGSHAITAVYGGAATFAGSTSSALTHVVAPPVAPANNLFANRRSIASPGTVTGTNVGATSEPGQPSIAVSNSTNAVWWRFTPSSNGQLTIDTAGSTFDTTLAVFTGSAVNALSEVASDDDAIGRQSRVSFEATSGVQYQIAVAGYSNASGPITLNVAFVPTAAVATTTTLESPDQGALGAQLTFRASVSATSGTPTGSVSFRRNGTQFATANLSGSGTASTSTSALPAGTHTITAHYLGAAGFQTSVSAARTLTITDPNQAAVEFVGGGAVFGASEGCSGMGLDQLQAVPIRYSPSEMGGLPSGVTLAWPDGSEHLTHWGPLAPSGESFLGGTGRQAWTRFLFFPTRPLIRVVSREVTAPAGAALTAAEEVLLRLRVQHFGAQVGCAVTIVATLRRG